MNKLCLGCSWRTIELKQFLAKNCKNFQKTDEGLICKRSNFKVSVRCCNFICPLSLERIKTFQNGTQTHKGIKQIQVEQKYQQKKLFRTTPKAMGYQESASILFCFPHELGKISQSKEVNPDQLKKVIAQLLMQTSVRTNESTGNN